MKERMRATENNKTDRLLKEGYFRLFITLIIHLTIISFRIIVYGLKGKICKSLCLNEILLIVLEYKENYRSL